MTGEDHRLAMGHLRQRKPAAQRRCSCVRLKVDQPALTLADPGFWAPGVSGVVHTHRIIHNDQPNKCALLSLRTNSIAIELIVIQSGNTVRVVAQPTEPSW
jgi:hypothetical protein